MTPPRRPVICVLPIAFVTLLLAACAGELESYEAVKINEQQFPVESNATAECLRAAKRATSFCVGRGRSMMDSDAYADCNDARWDYHRYCN